MRSTIRIRERESGHLAGRQDVPAAEGLGQRILRVEGACDVAAYAWDVKLTAKIEAIHRHSHGNYGSPRVHRELRHFGVCVSRKRVARLMKAAGLRGARRRRFIVTTQRDFQAKSAPDLVQRHFAADAPNRLYVADITYIPTLEGFLFLAIVLDAFSRRVVGWAMADHLRTELVLAALQMAYTQRNPQRVIHHSDHGCQYTSVEFGRRCREWGVRPSMGTVGDCFDNAMAESFFASLECEWLWKHRFKTKAEAERATFQYIEGFYNPHRLHSSLDYLSPPQQWLCPSALLADTYTLVRHITPMLRQLPQNA